MFHRLRLHLAAIDLPVPTTIARFVPLIQQRPHPLRQVSNMLIPASLSQLPQRVFQHEQILRIRPTGPLTPGYDLRHLLWRLPAQELRVPWQADVDEAVLDRVGG